MEAENDTARQPAAKNQLGFLEGGGELGQLIRNFDWTSTSLGPPETWPPSLRMSLRIMFTSSQPIWVGWGDELIYFYNDPYKSIIGGKHPWALGRPTSEVWSDIWHDIGPMLATARSGDQGTYVEAQLLIMERNGSPEETYYTFSYSPVPNDDGTVGGIFCANSDDTQRVIGERQLALLRDLAASTAHARTWQEICRSSATALASNARDLPFALIYLAGADETALELVGWSGIAPGHPAAPQKLSLDEQASWPVGEALSSHAPVLVSGLDSIVYGELPTGPWQKRPSQAVVLPILPTSDTGQSGALVVGLNPFRLFDENYRGFLGLVAGQIAAGIANAQAYEIERRRAEALAEIDRTKTAFFSNVSHEFRTPLTLLLGPLEDALSDGTAAALPPTQRDRLDVAYRNGLRLLKLVNSLLDFSRIEAGRATANFEPTDLPRLTAELASNFEAATLRAGLDLRIDCPPISTQILVDRDMWEKVVLNLVSNAFKFTFSGEIAVRTRLVEDGDTFELTVSDTGVGVPEHELPKLFERFHRVEGQRSRSFEGSGIGLALVRELVKLHRGTIRAESAVGVGTKFIVSLPVDDQIQNVPDMPPDHRQPSTQRTDAYVEEALRWLPDEDPPIGKADPAPDAAGIGSAMPAGPVADVRTAGARILVADDNADMRGYVGRLLGTRWHVETVPNGRAALAAIRRSKPDLLLTDLMMPELDGIGLLREIRDDEALRDLSVILLSARAGEEARIEGLDAGADDYLTKPFPARELVARVNANLEMARVRREATRDLRESEARFRNMADNAPVMMWVTDATGSIVYLNRGWSEFTGQALEEALGLGAWNALHPEDRPASEEHFFKANAERASFRIEYRLRRADGVYRWALSAAAPRLSDRREFLGYICSVIDITDRREAEQVLRDANEVLERRVAAAITERAATEAQLRQAQKMEAIGRLTGGVAHDFNNVLQIIGGSCQLLSRDMAGNQRAERRLQTAMEAIARGSKLASQLLAFGRRQPLAPKVINLGRLVRGMDDMLRRAIGEGIEIETIIAGGLWNTFVDAVQVENAILNLAINARDAMEGHGRLTIEAGNASLDDSYTSRHADVTPGQYVMIAVTDTGVGIPAELLEQVFEPFFTTKPEGQGTGLGLSMVYGLVKQSKGHIKIYSEPGHGTTVRIYLPRAREQEDFQVEPETGPFSGGTETVLVVEDDEGVRDVVVDMLTELGYRVLKAREAAGALAIIESGVAIDLLFTDVVMPGPLRTPDLARAALKRLPDLAVLFTSGYTENAIVHGGRLDDGVELLSKPYSREALARKIRHVLRNRQQRRVAIERPSKPHDAVEAAPASPLRQTFSVLMVEDDPLVRMATAEMLSDLGHRVEQAASVAEALRVMASQTFDVLVTDISLPDLSGEELAARAIADNASIGIVFASGHDAPPAGKRRAGLQNAVYLRKPYNQAALERALDQAIGLAKAGAG